jgi:hypothetical protein
MILSKIIQRIKLKAFFLFIIPTIGIIGSLLVNNYFIGFKYEKPITKKYLTSDPNKEFLIDCTAGNNYCHDEDIQKPLNERSLKISDCLIYNVNFEYRVYGVENFKSYDLQTLYDSIDGKWSLKSKYKNNKIQYRESIANTKNLYCIKNYQIQYFFYKYFPPFSFILDKVSDLVEGGLNLGTSIKVNPFLYGETSISNLVKQYPINYFFKSFLYLGVILMFFYWTAYNQVFKIIINKKKNTFYFFGIASAFCLLFHIYFLGTSSENEILKDFRRIVIILFILFELLAQTFLAFKIYKYKNIFFKYSYSLIVFTKIIFVSIVLFSSLTIIFLLIFYDFPKNIDNILEWNYFIILLIFYLFSSLMWKKKIN